MFNPLNNLKMIIPLFQSKKKVQKRWSYPQDWELIQGQDYVWWIWVTPESNTRPDKHSGSVEHMNKTDPNHTLSKLCHWNSIRPVIVHAYLKTLNAI